ncbi:hypothetical protein U9M48_001585 [Paspalum notatum var. saurae]|uniref:Uncharacterized protein n=1 Tax=Paspalum notatum var. saurae TaxID=547442 RepID=A0AAQ3PII8_PASNO
MWRKMSATVSVSAPGQVHLLCAATIFLAMRGRGSDLLDRDLGSIPEGFVWDVLGASYARAQVEEEMGLSFRKLFSSLFAKKQRIDVAGA